MDGVMSKNLLTIVEEYEFDQPLIQKIDSIIDNCIRDCHNKYFHTFDHKCAYDFKFTNITNNGTVTLTIADKNMNLYELIEKKLISARKNCFIFNQTNTLTKKML